MWIFFLNVSQITSSVQSVDVIEESTKVIDVSRVRLQTFVSRGPHRCVPASLLLNLQMFFSFSFSFLSFVVFNSIQSSYLCLMC